MAQSARRSFNRKDIPGTEEELRRQAVDTVRERNDRAYKSLVEVQGRELKLLESERTWIEQQKARDVSPMNNKEIAGINQRYDRLQHEMQRKHNSFFGKMHRVVGGHKQQQKQLNALNGERNRVVAEREKQHVEREGQRQRSLTERFV